MRTIPRAAITKFVQDLGFDPDRVSAVRLAPGQVEVELFYLDADGKYVVQHDSAATVTATVEVVD